MPPALILRYLSDVEVVISFVSAQRALPCGDKPTTHKVAQLNFVSANSMALIFKYIFHGVIHLSLCEWP